MAASSGPGSSRWLTDWRLAEPSAWLKLLVVLVDGDAELSGWLLAAGRLAGGRLSSWPGSKLLVDSACCWKDGSEKQRERVLSRAKPQMKECKRTRECKGILNDANTFLRTIT